MHKLYPQCVDTNLLNVNEHSLSAHLASDCCEPFDDLEIATGQASFDDGGFPPHINTCINAHHSREIELEDPDDFSVGLDYKSPPARSAPARRWDIGSFGRSDSNTVLQYDSSSLVTESEPWSHLQTFARSAPEHDPQNSQHFQIEAISQWPLTLQGNDILHPTTTESRHQRQFSTKHKRMQQASRVRRIRPANLAMFQHRIPHADEQRMAGSFTSASPSQTATTGLHLERHFFDSPPAYPLLHPTFNEPRGSSSEMPQNYFSFDQGLIDESGHDSLPVSQNDQTPEELSWHPHEHLLFGRQLSASADTAYVSHDLDLDAHDPDWSSDFTTQPAFGFPTHQRLEDSNLLDRPGAIKIGGTSGNYKSDLPSSFPPSIGCFPDYMPTMQEIGPYRVIASTSPTFSPSNSPNLPPEKDSNRPPFARRSKSDSLSIIQEYGHSQHGSPTISRNVSGKGKRKGPLSTATAMAAAQKRKEGSVCIRCRAMKMTCKGGLPCEGCRQNSKARLWDAGCTPANFINIVEEGTCNAILQHPISYLTLDGSRRLVVPIPAALDVSGFLDRLESYHMRYDIRVRHSSDYFYTLDLSNCFKFLTQHKSCRLETCELQYLVNSKQKRSTWLECVREYDLSANVVDRFIQWNNMSSRSNYEVALHHTSELGHTLDVEDEQDRSTIIFALQLSRIVLRALEMEAFEALQKSVNELTKGGKSEADVRSLIDQLSRILMSLRWHVSWWAVMGDSPDEYLTARVTKLAQILYSYYFVARKKISSWSGQLPSKIRSSYAEVESIYEDLPLTDSLGGFYGWMQKGQAFVQAAKVEPKLPCSLPIASLNPHF